MTNTDKTVGPSDERLSVLLDSYTWLSRHPTFSGHNERAEKDAEHASIIRELQHCRSRYCPDCRGLGWVQNPDARYEMDYVDGHLATGVYSTIDPEEIDCPTCKGVGFVAPPKPLPTPYLPPEREDGMPF